MTSSVQSAQPATDAGPAESRPLDRHAKPRWAFPVLTALLFGLVIAGFWPYWRAGGRMTPPRPWLIHVHAAVFVSWMVVLLVQVILIWKKRTDLHRRFGRMGFVIGLLVVLMGLAVMVVVPPLHYARGESTLDDAASFLLILIGDVTLFTVFFAAGMIYRRRPEVHKRCLLMATTALMFAPVGRLVSAPLPALALFFSPVLLAAAIDWRTRGRVHPAYFVGLAVLAAGVSRVLVTSSPGWLKIGRAVVTGLAPSVGRLF